MQNNEEILNWSRQEEGQFFERKSAFDRSGGRTKRRKAAEIAKDIVETLSAMANADGGELVVGIENDGQVTGVPHAEDKIELFLRAPRDRNYIVPPLSTQCHEIRTAASITLLHFQVDWSPEVHRLSDGRYLLRVRDRNSPFAAEQISALKSSKGQGLFERRLPAEANLEDMELELINRLHDRLGSQKSEIEILKSYHLVESRNGRLKPCLAGLLLFGKDPCRWHPRPGIEIIRWEGSKRKHGSTLNIVNRIRLERPLAILIQEAFLAIKPFIRERQQLMDLFFSEQLEYPTFVWQEALINAVAHRDYSFSGANIEVHLFDDRMEVRSPGLPPAPITVEALNQRKNLHLSRNPLMVRVFTDMGYMRELGEGIPRMFEVMEREGFYPPQFEDLSGVNFQVTLRNQPVHDQETASWLLKFKNDALSGDQKRILAYAHAHDHRFTSRDYQKLVGIDLYKASNSIKDLSRKGIVRPVQKGGRVYEVMEQKAEKENLSEGLKNLISGLGREQLITNRMVRDYLKVTRATATRYLQKWVEMGWLIVEGKGRGRKYKLDPKIDSTLNESRLI